MLVSTSQAKQSTFYSLVFVSRTPAARVLECCVYFPVAWMWRRLGWSRARGVWGG